MKTTAEQVAHNVQKARKARGWTPEQLGVYSGLSDETVRNLEAGRGSPRLATLIAIADALEIGLASLVRQAS